MNGRTARVIVGVDGTEGSIEALRWAAHEAARRRWPLSIVTCAELPLAVEAGAVGAGGVGSSSSLSTGKGTTSSAGGGNAGAFAGAQSRSDDGASHRGSYRLNALTIELAYDDGRKTSVLCAPWGADGRSIYMFGQTFSRR